LVTKQRTGWQLVHWASWALIVLHTHSFGLLVIGWQALYLLVRSLGPAPEQPAPPVSRKWCFTCVVLTILMVGLLYTPQSLRLLGRAQTKAIAEQPFTWSACTWNYLSENIIAPLGPDLAQGAWVFPCIVLLGWIGYLHKHCWAGIWLTGWLILLPLIILYTLASKQTFFASRYFIFLCPLYAAFFGIGLEQCLQGLGHLKQQCWPGSVRSLKPWLAGLCWALILLGTIPQLSPRAVMSGDLS
jgi:hypothetical protein